MKSLVHTVLSFALAASSAATAADFETRAFGISGDGSTVVGKHTGLLPGGAFRWTASQGVSSLGTLATSAFGVSADGRTIVGASDGGGTLAFRWTASTGMQSLGTLSGASWSTANAVSSDGAVVVGQSGGRAFRWSSASGMQELLSLPLGVASDARGTNIDGSVIVGRRDGSNYDWGSASMAIRWTASSGAEDLGWLSGDHGSSAVGVSANGMTVAGNSYRFTGGQWLSRSFLWSAGSGMVEMQKPEWASESVMAGLSADGTTAVGTLIGEAPYGFAALWTQPAGLVSLKDLLATSGVDLSGWSWLIDANAVSSDGRFIAGTGLYGGLERAFVVDRSLGTITAIGVIPSPATLIAIVTGGLITRRRRG